MGQADLQRQHKRGQAVVDQWDDGNRWGDDNVVVDAQQLLAGDASFGLVQNLTRLTLVDEKGNRTTRRTSAKTILKGD